MIRAFIFDLDGVLVNTAQYHFQAWSRVANALDISFSETDNEHLKGVSRKESMEKILEMGGKSVPEQEKETLMAQKNDWYLELIEKPDAIAILPGVQQFLEQSRAMKIKIALGSASQNAATILNLTNLTPFFEAVIDGTSTEKSKPDPTVFLMGAEALGAPPNKTVVFEDSIAGITAAKTGGFKSVGIGNEKLLKKADVTIHGLEEKSASEILNLLNFL